MKSFLVSKNRELQVRAALWFLSFGSIFTLLGFLYGAAPMHVLGRWVLLPSLLLISLLWFWAYKKGLKSIHEAMFLGLIGGFVGTLGYDLVRIPMHFFGFNPFPPIQSYGMYLLNVQSSTVLSDLTGLFYHFSNGITFAWIYSLVMKNKSIGWAVLWGLLLETLAVLTPFGAIYGIRTAYKALAIAYGAHLFYGFPLGWFCEKPLLLRQRLNRIFPYIMLATLVVGLFFWEAWHLGRGEQVPANTILVREDFISETWTRSEVGQMLTVKNELEEVLDFEILGITERMSLSPGDSVAIEMDTVGLHQFLVHNPLLRSVMISVEKGGFPFDRN
ncbi:hypothetical protein IPG41_01350 [Candidatus Peregrinibacteria bacterium]|nr:MAG: hypothetical protein IPG41_01350 [Candidatus Peregrinibacteria bacterium]